MISYVCSHSCPREDWWKWSLDPGTSQALPCLSSEIWRVLPLMRKQWTAIRIFLKKPSEPADVMNSGRSDKQLVNIHALTTSIQQYIQTHPNCIRVPCHSTYRSVEKLTPLTWHETFLCLSATQYAMVLMAQTILTQCGRPGAAHIDRSFWTVNVVMCWVTVSPGSRVVKKM